MTYTSPLISHFVKRQVPVPFYRCSRWAIKLNCRTCAKKKKYCYLITFTPHGVPVHDLDKYFNIVFFSLLDFCLLRLSLDDLPFEFELLTGVLLLMSKEDGAGDDVEDEGCGGAASPNISTCKSRGSASQTSGS